MAAAPSGGGAVDYIFEDVNLPANGAPGKAYPIYTIESGTLTNVKLTIDLSNLSGIATVSFPDPTTTCTVTGDTAVCDLPDSTDSGPDDEGTFGVIPMKLVPGTGAVNGAKASITATISADGAAPVSAETHLTVTDGPDLTLLQQQVNASVQPGDTTNMPYSMQNNGSQAADMIVADFVFTGGMAAQQYKNCAYFPVDETEWFADCEFAQSLAPGEQLDGTLPLRVAADAALQEAGVVIVSPGPLTSDSMSKRWEKLRAAHLGRSSTKLSLRRASGTKSNAADIDLNDNIGFAMYDVKTSLDVAATGQSVSGDAGTTTDMTVGIVNNGPASINQLTTYGPDDDSIVGFLVKVPSWASVEKAPKYCGGRATPTGSDHPGKAGYAYYYCADHVFADDPGPLLIGVGAKFQATFSVKIKSSSGADGAVTADTTNGAAKTDTDASNDVAKITLAPGATPSLPITGSNAGEIAGGGAALVLLGGVLFYLGRRRKRATSPLT